MVSGEIDSDEEKGVVLKDGISIYIRRGLEGLVDV